MARMYRDRRWGHRLAATLTVGALVAATLSTVATAGASERSQKGGGDSVTFALEAESSGGWCLPQAQLAAGGIQVSVAIYDTLTTIDSKGEYVPYLAKSVTPNDTYDEWTIGLRDGVTFHDRTPVDAESIKLNIDAFRGVKADLPVRLGVFTFENIDTVTVVDPLTVVVTTKTPWPAFPAYFSGGRAGISAPAQLNDPDTCPSNMIGSGPFVCKEGCWRPNESVTLEANPDYWQEGYPKVDELIFRPVGDSQSRLNGLQSGELDLIQTSNSLSIVDMQERKKNGDIKLLATDKGAEVAYLMLNAGKPPFDSEDARQAVAWAGDAKEVNEIRNRGLNTIANGPFPPDSPIYDPQFVRGHNLKKAKQFVKKWEDANPGETLSFEYATQPEPDTLAIAQLVKEQQAKAGIEVSIRTIDQATLINDVLAGNFQGAGFRNHPGGDPDTQYVWWHSESPVNFGRINDPVIDQALEEGRVELDPEKRIEIYQGLNKQFFEKLYNLWSWYTFWAVGYQTDVGGAKGAPLPDKAGTGKPFPLFAGVIPVLAITKK